MKKKAASKLTKRAKSAKPVKASPPSDATASETASETPGETAEAPAAAAVVVAEPASSAKPDKPPRRSAAKKRTSIRYTPEAKAEILQFVRDHDKTHTRGGQAAAVKKFGVTALSISKWQKASKSAGKPAAAKAIPITPAPPATATAQTKRGKAGGPAKEAKSGGPVVGSIKATLDRMLEIGNQIDALNAEFEDLKTRI